MVEQEGQRPAGGSGEVHPFDIIGEGIFSGVPDPCVVGMLTFAIRTVDEWNLFWSVHPTTSPPPPIPAVDFTQNSVIVVMQSANTMCWTVDATTVTEFDDHVEVDVTVEDPEGCLVILTCTAPHQLLLVPALTTDGDVIANVTTLFPCL